MNSEELTEPTWVGHLCRIASVWPIQDSSIRELFQQAAPDLSDDTFQARVSARLSQEPEWIDLWEMYSGDQRASPNPYFEGHTVGFFDGERHDIRVHEVRSDACADFLFRLSAWVLERRRAS